MIMKEKTIFCSLLYIINTTEVAASQMAESFPITESASMEQLPKTLDNDAVFSERERTQETIIKRDLESGTTLSQKDASMPSEREGMMP